MERINFNRNLKEEKSDFKSKLIVSSMLYLKNNKSYNVIYVDNNSAHK